MGIRKNHSLGRQPVHVRRQGLRVALQHAGPVIQIIDGDEQYIWLLILLARILCFTGVGQHAKQQHGQNEYRGLFLCFHHGHKRVKYFRKLSVETGCG